MKKSTTLEAYVAQYPSQEIAAAEIGVAFTTLSRWLNGHNRPRGLQIKRLQELGIKTVAGQRL